jgi:16S rRNA (guanine966-N2)-methyltransferase
LGTVRIVAGRLRGRRLHVLDDPGLRPTGDRVREALFNILGQDMTGLSILDLFAGTGAFGFEALSRGARRVVFVDSNSRAVQAIRRTAAELGVEREARVVVGRVDEVLRARRIDGPFDVILADPPYAETGEEGLVAAVSASGLLDPGGVLAVEREARGEVPAGSGSLAAYRTARYGRTAIDFFKFS